MTRGTLKRTNIAVRLIMNYSKDSRTTQPYRIRKLGDVGVGGILVGGFAPRVPTFIFEPARQAHAARKG